MLKKQLMTGLAVCMLAGSSLFSIGAVNGQAASSKAVQSSSETSSAVSSSAQEKGTAKHGRGFIGGDRMAAVLLADLLKKSVKEVNAQYPQQTPWQIAKHTGQLDPLKKNHLKTEQERIRNMQEHAILSQVDGTKLFEELAARVARIDGVKTVTVGHIHL